MPLSLRYWSGTVISIDTAVPRDAVISTTSGISSIIISVLLPASLLISKICAHSRGLVIEYLAEVDTSVIPATFSNSNVESISIPVGMPTCRPFNVIRRS